MRFMSLIKGTIGKARRGLTRPVSIGMGDKEPNATELAQVIRHLSLRVAALEKLSVPEATEFEVKNASTSGAKLVFYHGYGGPIRWWVTSWGTNPGGVAPSAAPGFVMDIDSTPDILVLRAYVIGRAVIRIEPSPYQIENA